MSTLDKESDHQLNLIQCELQTLDLLQAALRGGADKSAVAECADRGGNLTELLGQDPRVMSLEALTTGIGQVRIDARKKLISKRAHRALLIVGGALVALGAVRKGAVSVLTGLSMATIALSRQPLPDLIPYQDLKQYLELARDAATSVKRYLSHAVHDPKKLTDTVVQRHQDEDADLYKRMSALTSNLDHPKRVTFAKAGYTADNINQLIGEAITIGEQFKSIESELNSLLSIFHIYATENYYDNDDADSERYDQGFLASKYADNVLAEWYWYIDVGGSVLAEIATVAKLIKGAHVYNTDD